MLQHSSHQALPHAASGTALSTQYALTLAQGACQTQELRYVHPETALYGWPVQAVVPLRCHSSLLLAQGLQLKHADFLPAANTAVEAFSML